MHDVKARAVRVVIAHAYILYFRRPSPMAGTGMTSDEAERIRTALEAIRDTGLVPDAEIVTVDHIFETFAAQPGDVQAVFRRLVTEFEILAADPILLSAVAAHRRRYYPGVLESARLSEPQSG